VDNLLKSLLEEICGIDRGVVTDGASIDQELRLESAQLAQVQVELEDRLEISIDFLEILQLREFSRIVDYVWSLTRSQA
jgi:acyl carrier protein